MKKAYSYIRFSTPEQARGDSLRRQTAKADAWCRERGIALDDTIHDLGVSAYHGANRVTGALRAFLDHVEKGEIARGSYLIVESLDRISREAVMDAASRLFDLIRAGIIVVTLSDGQEYSEERIRTDFTPLVFSLIVMARAHEESRIKSERVGEAWKQKKAKARTEGKPLTPRCPEWLEIQHDRFVERPERVAVIRRIFRETIDGFGRREIVRRLNEEAILPFRGGKGWQTSSIAKIIEGRAVLGEYQPHTGTHRNRDRTPEGDPIPNFYPGVIDEDTFWQARAAVQGRRSAAAGRKGTHGSHIFQGLAHCASCGGPMHILNKGKPPKGGIYLACSSNIRSAGCDNERRWRVDKLEPALIRSLDMLDFKVLNDIDPAAPQMAAKADAIRVQIEDYQRRQRTLVALVEAEDEIATGRSLELAKAIKQARAELKRAEAEQAKAAAAPDLAERIIDTVALSRKLLDSDDPKAKRELRTRLREGIRGIVLDVECDPRFGAIANFLPRKRFLMDTTKSDAPEFVVKTKQGRSGIETKVLLDWPDTADTVVNEWLGFPADWP